MADDAQMNVRVPKALRKLLAVGDSGMTCQDFFEVCRKEDGEQEPLSALKELYDAGYVTYIKGNPLKVRLSAR